MNVTQFAEQHRLKVRRDDCGEKIISGKAGHVYENGDDRFGICLMFKSARKWMSVQRRLLAAGFALEQDGDTEGTLLFDPTNADQLRSLFANRGFGSAECYLRMLASH